MSQMIPSAEDKVTEAWTRLHREWPNHKDVNVNEIMDKYNHWDLYDEDMVTLGYHAPEELLKGLLKLEVPKDASILDIMCGTGLVGEELKKEGYHEVDGHDGSPLLIKYADRKGIFKKTFCFMIEEDKDLPIPDLSGKYDVVLCAGGMSPGHIKAAAFVGILKLIKPGGYFGHTARASHLSHPQFIDYLDLMDSYTAEGKLEKVLDERYESYYRYTNDEPINLDGFVHFYRIS